MKIEWKVTTEKVHEITQIELSGGRYLTGSVIGDNEFGWTALLNERNTQTFGKIRRFKGHYQSVIAAKAALEEAVNQIVDGK